MSALRHLVLVRHGETAGESSIRYHGANDVELSAVGIEQMKRVAAALAGEQFELAITSKLRRTVEAARIIAPNVRVIAAAGFNEINFGEWEGLTSDEIRARDPQAYTQWRATLHDFAYPSGDSVKAFRARVVATFGELVPQMAERTLIVAHKGVISAIVAELLGLSLEQRAQWPIDLASVHVLRRATDVWSADVVNKTDHLEDG
jgi:broad specificity phosphatase PhoE